MLVHSLHAQSSSEVSHILERMKYIYTSCLCLFAEEDVCRGCSVWKAACGATMILRGLGARSRLRPGAALVCARQLSRVPPARRLQLPQALPRALLAPRRTALLCTKPPAETKVAVKPPEAPPPARWSPSWVALTVKEVALHYWHGSKLLVTLALALALALAPVSYTHLRAHETPEHLVCRLLLEKKK